MALYPESDSVNGYSVIITGDLTLTPSNQGNFNEKLIVCQNTVNTTITLGMEIRNNFKTMIRASATGTVTVVPVAGVMLNGSSTPFVMPAGLGNLLEIVYGVRNSLTVTQVGGSTGPASTLSAQRVAQLQSAPSGQAVATARYPSAIMRPDPNFLPGLGNGSANNFTESIKWQVPFPFTGVRLWVFDKFTATASALKAIVAPTETAADDTDLKRYTPIIGGVSRNTLQNQNVPGWTPVTWAGAASAPTTATGTAVLESVRISDRVALNSVANTDGVPGYYLLARINAPNDAGSYSQNVGVLDANAGFPNAKIQVARRNGADGVGTLTNYPLGTAVTTNSMLNIWPELYTQGNAGTALIIGDSITIRSNTTDDANSGASWIGVAAYNGLPASGIVHVGIGGQAPVAWKAEFDMLMAAGLKPRYVIMPAGSPNGAVNAQTIQGIQLNQLSTDQMLDYCNANNIKVFMWTPYPYAPAVGYVAANQQIVIDYATAAAAAGRCVLVPTHTIFPPNTTAHLQADGIHPTLACCNAFGAMMQSVLAANP